MKQINTIQKREKLNDIYINDEKGNGGANHAYSIYGVGIEKDGCDAGAFAVIQFQNGGRNTEESISGIIDTDLLEICRHRLQCFQAGQFSSRENAIALTHIEEALMWLNRRVEERADRKVLGKNIK